MNNSNKQFQGLYGSYVITEQDIREVNIYRFSLLCCGVTFLGGLTEWLLFGPSWSFLWLIALAISLGSSLFWIHIYLKSILNILKILWIMGCIGIVIYFCIWDPRNFLQHFTSERISTIIIGPLFASLSGLGFKEFFCFRRPEAFGISVLIPFSLLGYITGFISGNSVMILLLISSILLLILGLRKFSMDPASDIGDKSIFEFIKNQNNLVNNQS